MNSDGWYSSAMSTAKTLSTGIFSCA